MWIPRDIAEIEAAAADGTLEETASFDGKLQLPTQARNVDLAIDVAAMSTEGGTLLYGIGEDGNHRLTVLNPVDLTGVSERIDRVVGTSIAEVPYIEIREYYPDEHPSTGYVLVIVPQSPRAPHQVTVGNDRRFYGRGATGNRRLTESEIALLYARRQAWEQNRDGLLVDAWNAVPFASLDHLSYLYGFAQPLPPNREIWDRAIASAGSRDALLQQIQAATTSPMRSGGFDLRHGFALTWQRDGADGWRLSGQRERDVGLARYLGELTLNIDGRGHLFFGGAGERANLQTGPSPDGERFIYEADIAGSVAAFLAGMAALYGAAAYHGHVDLGLGVTNLRGAYSMAALSGRQFQTLTGLETFSGQEYRRTERVSAAELSDPEDVARRLLRHLFEATTRRDDYDPFAT